MDTLSLARLMEQMQLRTSAMEQSVSDAAPEDGGNSRLRIAREEAALERKIVRMIGGGNWDALKPNSGNAVSIGDHCVCVGFQEDPQAGYRTWEWHGHLLLLDEEKGYIPEFVYGNYFQPMEKKGVPEDTVVANGIGLGGIIDGEDRRQGSILHRNVNVNSSLSMSHGAV